MTHPGAIGQMADFDEVHIMCHTRAAAPQAPAAQVWSDVWRAKGGIACVLISSTLGLR